MLSLGFANASAADLLARWDDFLRQPNVRSIPRLLHEVQAFFSTVGRASDHEVWGMPDYWASPRELLRAGRGDCEDLAIAKFYTLLALGIPEQDLRLVYGKRLHQPSGRIEPHMVLLYQGGRGAPLVMDNRSDTIDRLAERTDLVLEYGFNNQDLWIYRSGIGAEQIGLSSALVAWRQLHERMAMDSSLAPLASSDRSMHRIDG